MKIKHTAELLISIFAVVWIYSGVPLVIEKEVSLGVFLIMSGALLYGTYKLIFTEEAP